MSLPPNFKIIFSNDIKFSLEDFHKVIEIAKNDLINYEKNKTK